MVRSPFPFFVILPTRWRNMQVSTSTPAGIRMGIQHRSAASAERYGLAYHSRKVKGGHSPLATTVESPVSDACFLAGSARQSPVTSHPKPDPIIFRMENRCYDAVPD